MSQEAFVQAFVKLDSFRGRSAFYTWLYRIAFNVSISRRRRQTFGSVDGPAPRAHGGRTRGCGRGPDGATAAGGTGAAGPGGDQALNEEHRSILVLREMEGCDYETMAEILDMPIGTVRSRLHRARLQLREQLKEMLQENLTE